MLIVLVFVAGCSCKVERDLPAEKVTIAAYAGDTGALVYIAQQQGFFANHGLDVTIKDYEAGKLATDALLRGEADLSTATISVFVSNGFARTDLRTFGTIALAEINEMVARRDRGIGSPADLKGKRIGITRKSVGEFYLGRFLLSKGLSFEDVEIVDKKPGEIVQGVIDGSLDAGYTWDPNVYDMKQGLGDNAVSWPGQGGMDFYFILITTDGWLTKYPSLAERVIAALLEAERYIREHGDEAREFVRKKFALQPDYIQYAWKKHTFQVRLTQAILLSMEDQARWRIEHGLTDAKEVPDYLDSIYLDALKKIKPDAVSIIQ